MDGGYIPHVKAGAADPLQECLRQLRGDIIHRVQLLGGVVIADKQPNLADRDGKMGEISEEGQVAQGDPSWQLALCPSQPYGHATSSQIALFLFAYYFSNVQYI